MKHGELLVPFGQVLVCTLWAVKEKHLLCHHRLVLWQTYKLFHAHSSGFVSRDESCQDVLKPTAVVICSPRRSSSLNVVPCPVMVKSGWVWSYRWPINFHIDECVSVWVCVCTCVHVVDSFLQISNIYWYSSITGRFFFFFFFWFRLACILSNLTVQRKIISRMFRSRCSVNK